MKCGCGRLISRHMKGKCMACRMKEKTGNHSDGEADKNMEYKKIPINARICPVCGKQFYLKRRKEQVCCSRACRSNVVIKKICLACGKEFECKASSSRKYCLECNQIRKERKADTAPPAKGINKRGRKAKMKAIAASGMTYGQYMAYNGVPPQEPAELKGTLRPTEAWMEGTGQIRIGREGPPPKAWIKRL